MESQKLPDTTKQQSEGAALVAKAHAIKVVDQPGYDQAAELLLIVKGLSKQISDLMDPIAKSAFDHHKSITSRRAALLEFPSQAESILKTAMGVWVRKEEQRREAEAAAERRRLQLEAEAEQARLQKLQAEENARIRAAAAAEQARLQALADAQTQREAEELAAAGLHEEAAAHIDAAPEVPMVVPPVVELPPPVVIAPPVAAPAPVRPTTAKGITTTQVWKFRVIDEMKIGRAYFKRDDSAIGAVVKALKKDAEKAVGGIEVYSESQIGARVG